MTTFSSLKAALNAGFKVTEFIKELDLWQVELDRFNPTSGRREKALAFANP